MKVEKLKSNLRKKMMEERLAKYGTADFADEVTGREIDEELNSLDDNS
jgi:hypothetical protein